MIKSTKIQYLNYFKTKFKGSHNTQTSLSVGVNGCRISIKWSILLTVSRFSKYLCSKDFQELCLQSVTFAAKPNPGISTMRKSWDFLGGIDSCFASFRSSHRNNMNEQVTTPRFSYLVRLSNLFPLFLCLDLQISIAYSKEIALSLTK